MDLADIDTDTDGEGKSSMLVLGVAGLNSDRRGSGTFAGSTCQYVPVTNLVDEPT
jgi:hypothetical protein